MQYFTEKTVAPMRRKIVNADTPLWAIKYPNTAPVKPPLSYKCENALDYAAIEWM